MNDERDREPVTMVFLLVENHALMPLVAAIEPLRALNRLTGREAYRWRFASLEGGPVMASAGIPVPTEPLETALEGARYLFVCGGLRIQAPDERRIVAALRKAARAGIALGSLSTGTHLLARAGVLNGYRCTIHWENQPAFREEFAGLDCTGNLYEIDRDRLTCSGGTATLDLVLHLIAERHGPELARRVANQFHHERIRDEREEQRGGRTEHMSSLPASIRAAVEMMQRNVEGPLSIAAIARRLGFSPRQLERLFRRYLQVTPARYYLSVRIDRARELLLYSDRPIIDVAVASGFTSTSHFSHWFKTLQGVRPSALRAGRGTGSPVRRSDSPAVAKDPDEVANPSLPPAAQ